MWHYTPVGFHKGRHILKGVILYLFNIMSFVYAFIILLQEGWN